VRLRAPLLVLTVALAGGLVVSGTALGQPRIGADELVERLRRALAVADLDGARPSADRMEQVREALGLPVEVVIGDWVVEVQPDPTLEGLSGQRAADFDSAADRLRVLEESLDQALAREVPEPAGVAAALDEAYRSVIPARPDVPAMILRAVGEAIGAILYRLANIVGGAGGVLAWVVVLAIAVGGALLLWRARLVPDRALPMGGGQRRAVGPADWTMRADEAISAGDLREAVRALYLALLAGLAGRGLVADVPALTAGEARAAVRRTRPTLLPLVARATESYERVVYGGDAPEERDLEQLREAATLARKA
jgi:hypothetical protein